MTMSSQEFTERFVTLERRVDRIIEHLERFLRAEGDDWIIVRSRLEQWLNVGAAS